MTRDDRQTDTTYLVEACANINFEGTTAREMAILSMHFVDGQDQAAIAKELEVSRQYVNKVLKVALGKLREANPDPPPRDESDADAGESFAEGEQSCSPESIHGIDDDPDDDPDEGPDLLVDEVYDEDGTLREGDYGDRPPSDEDDADESESDGLVAVLRERGRPAKKRKHAEGPRADNWELIELAGRRARKLETDGYEAAKLDWCTTPEGRRQHLAKARKARQARMVDIVSRVESKTTDTTDTEDTT